MKYCVVITISRIDISFHYYQETVINGEKSAMMPFWSKGATIPMAMYVSENRIDFTEEARINAKNKVQGFYDNVLSFLGKNETIEYLHKPCDYRDMIKIGIEHKLLDFLGNTLFLKGGLEAHRANMPIIFIFQPDVQPNEENFIIESFIKAGYGNITTIDPKKIIFDYCSSKTQLRHLLILSSDRKNLYTYLYDSQTRKSIARKVFNEMGKDQRVDNLVRCIFSSFDQDHNIYFYDHETELAGVTQYAEEFIASGNREIYDEEYELSDGQHTYLNVDALTIKNLLSDSSVDIATVILNFMNSYGASSEDTTIALTRYAKNDYFKNAFRGRLKNVIIVDDEAINSLIVLFIQQHNYRFEQKASHDNQHIKVSEPKNEAISSNIQKDPDTLKDSDTAKDSDTTSVRPSTHNINKRVVRDVKTFVRSYKSRADVMAAIAEGEQLLNAAKGMIDDSTIQNMNNALSELRKKSNTKDVAVALKVPPIPNSRNTRMKSKLLRDTKVILNNWKNRPNREAVISEMEQLLSDLQANGVTDPYVDKLQGALKEAKKGPVVDVSKFEKEVTRTVAMSRHMVADDAIKKIDDLLNKLHSKGVTNFDVKLNAAKAEKLKEVNKKKVDAKQQKSPSKLVTNAKQTSVNKFVESSPRPLSTNSHIKTTAAKSNRNKSDSPTIPIAPPKLPDLPPSLPGKNNRNKSDSPTIPIAPPKLPDLPPSLPGSNNRNKLDSPTIPTTSIAPPTLPDAQPSLPGRNNPFTALIISHLTAKSGLDTTSYKIPKDTIASNKRVLDKGNYSMFWDKNIDYNGITYKLLKSGNVVALTSNAWKNTVTMPIKIKVADIELFVTSVASKGFFSTSGNLTAIVIPESLREIGNFAFSYSEISSISLPQNLKTIGDYAFNNCKNLKEILIPNSVTKLGDHAFDGCSRLERIQMPSIDVWNDALKGCKGLKEIKFTSTTAPKVLGNVKSWESLYDRVKILVPRGGKTNFAKHAVWGKFKEIEIY